MTNTAVLYVEICVYKTQNGIPRYLILHRSNEEKIYPGIFQFITGTIEEGESAIDTVLREMDEEIQISPRSLWTVPYISAFYDTVNDTVNLSPVFLAEIKVNDAPILSHEHQSFKWLEFEEASDILNWPTQREALRIVNDFLKGKIDRGKLTKINLDI
jgi:dihydroneopterin triphosphate diphosphatase